jgi:ferric-dicitrate binding protein FerR (iron transport regulator)
LFSIGIKQEIKMNFTEEYKKYTTDDFILDESFRKIVASPDGKHQLAELLKDTPSKEKEIRLAVQIIRKLQTKEFQQPEERKQELWQQLLQKRGRKIRLNFVRYAAGFLLLAALGGSIFVLFDRKPEEKIVISEVIPGGDALLELSDGKVVAITSENSSIQYSPDGSGITVNDTSGLAQTNLNEGINRLIVPYGKRSFVTLSDGTKVWMNSGSKLVFPPVFKGKMREVTLEGEALFDVAADKGKPFFVNTDLFRLKVYGTKFNVQAYQPDQEYHVVLVEGKISLKGTGKLPPEELFLDPNQKASISKDTETFEIRNIENSEIYTAWVDGYLTFVNEDVSEVLKRVSRYYNAEIICRFPENYEKIYGKLDLKTDMERVLDGVAFISNSEYIKQGNQYVFMRK